MSFKPYRPSIRSLKEEWSRRITRRVNRERRIKRHGPPPPKPDFDMDNSEPWVRNPSCIADFISISDQIEASTHLWQSRFNAS